MNPYIQGLLNCFGQYGQQQQYTSSPFFPEYFTNGFPGPRNFPPIMVHLSVPLDWFLRNQPFQPLPPRAVQHFNNSPSAFRPVLNNVTSQVNLGLNEHNSTAPVPVVATKATAVSEIGNSDSGLKEAENHVGAGQRKICPFSGEPIVGDTNICDKSGCVCRGPDEHRLSSSSSPSGSSQDHQDEEPIPTSAPATVVEPRVASVNEGNVPNNQDQSSSHTSNHFFSRPRKTRFILSRVEASRKSKRPEVKEMEDKINGPVLPKQSELSLLNGSSQRITGRAEIPENSLSEMAKILCGRDQASTSSAVIGMCSSSRRKKSKVMDCMEKGGNPVVGEVTAVTEARSRRVGRKPDRYSPS